MPPSITSSADANDILDQFDASRGCNPTPTLEQIRVRLLAINAAAAERNPPELGIMACEMKRVKNGGLYRIPASPDTRGHAATGPAPWWKQQLQTFLAQDAGSQ